MPTDKNFMALTDRQSKAIQNLFRRLPSQVGQRMTAFYKANFKRQGFLDNRVERWPKRKRGTRRDRATRRRRQLLVQSGRLKRSIRITRKTSNSVAVGTNVKYAAIHNEGGTINHPGGTPYIMVDGKTAFISEKKASELKAEGYTIKRTKAHKITIPKRQFIGPSKRLNELIIKGIDKELRKILPGT